MQSIMFALLSFRSRLEDLKQRERGATGVEYGLLVALIAAVIVAVVGFLGQDILQAFDTIENQLGGDDG